MGVGWHGVVLIVGVRCGLRVGVVVVWGVPPRRATPAHIASVVRAPLYVVEHREGGRMVVHFGLGVGRRVMGDRKGRPFGRAARLSARSWVPAFAGMTGETGMMGHRFVYPCRERGRIWFYSTPMSKPICFSVFFGMLLRRSARVFSYFALA